MSEAHNPLEAVFFDTDRVRDGVKIRRGGEQKAKLHVEMEREDAKIAAAEERLKVLRRVARGDYRDRVIHVDAMWEKRGEKVVGSGLAVFQERTFASPSVCAGPHELYAAVLLKALGRVFKQTGSAEGLTINFAKTPDPETMRLLTEAGAWNDHFNWNGGGQRPSLTLWMCLSMKFESGEVRYRQAPLPEDNAETLAYMAKQARHLRTDIGDLPPGAFDRIFNEPRRTKECADAA